MYGVALCGSSQVKSIPNPHPFFRDDTNSADFLAPQRDIQEHRIASHDVIGVGLAPFNHGKVSGEISACWHQSASNTHCNIVINLLSQIHENPAGFELDNYMQKLNYTPDHLRRIVKKAVGKTPHQLVIDAKIKPAKFLLHESDMSVGDIADQMGYANVHYFSLQFKQVTGSAPTVYRRQQQVK